MVKRYYEVRIHMGSVPMSDYLSWLKPHVQAMLALPYFSGVEIWQGLGQMDQASELVVRYELVGPDSLQSYLQEGAAKMRGQLPEQWLEQVRFQRATVVENSL